MEQPVKGQVAIVTGAGQGIGRAIALRLSQDGMNLVLADLQGDAVAHVADEIRAGGGEALALSVNILHVDDRQRMIQTALSTFHRLDALVNNAGVQRIALPLDVSEEHWDIVMNVNAKATYFCCPRYGVRVNAVCPGMIETPMQDVVDHEVARLTGQTPAEIRTERNARIPLGYIGDGADAAALVSFLVGPDSRYMTGQALNADGGILTY